MAGDELGHDFFQSDTVEGIVGLRHAWRQKAGAGAGKQTFGRVCMDRAVSAAYFRVKSMTLICSPGFCSVITSNLPVVRRKLPLPMLS